MAPAGPRWAAPRTSSRPAAARWPTAWSSCSRRRASPRGYFLKRALPGSQQTLRRAAYAVVMVLNKKWIIGSGAAAVLLAGGIYGGTALAQSAPPSAKPSAAASAAAKPGAPDRQAFLQHLAQRLNISVDALQNAFKGAAHDSVADALSAGRITQDQANQANQRID